MQHFFTNTEVGGLVSNILYNANMPQYKSVTRGDYIIKGMKYSYGMRTIKCTKSGYIEDGGKYITDSMDFLSNRNEDMAFLSNFRNVSRFSFINDYYDSDKHEMLGDYLRYYRSRTGIDLMPFYNCFSYRNANRFYVDSTSGNIVYGENSAYKTFIVPVQYNTNYSLCIDSSYLLLMPVIYKNGRIRTLSDDEKHILKIEEIRGDKAIKKDAIHKSYSEFKTPIYFSVPMKPKNEDDEDNKEPDVPFNTLASLYKSLYIVLQIPSNNSSSIAIIEGIKKKKSKNVVIDFSYDFSNVSSEDMNYLFESNLSLMKMNDETIYAFSDRLIEYLLKNVVDKSEGIKQNVMSAKDSIEYKSESVVYDNNLRARVFAKCVADMEDPLDINGYIDKDTEKLIKMR